jgi:hypothetical protein
MTAQTLTSPRTKVNWTSVIVYYVLACAISWPFFWWRDMHNDSWNALHLPGFLKTWFIMWGPGLSALICFALFRKSHVRNILFFGTSVWRSILFYVLPVLALCIPGIKDGDQESHILLLHLL